MKKLILAGIALLSLVALANAQTVTVSGTLSPSSGGTGLTTVGSSGTALLSNGTSLYYGTIAGGSSTVNIGSSLSAANPMISGDATSGLYAPLGSTVSIITGGTERLRIGSTGLIGVGTTSPTSPLTVYADSPTVPNILIGTGASAINYISFSGGRGMVGYDPGFTGGGASGAITLNGGTSKGIELLSGGTNGTFLSGGANLVVTPGGGVGIGTAAPITGSLLTVGGHPGFYQAAVPVVSSCGGGTAATGSTDNKGQITGVTSAAACTVTFSSALPAAPACSLIGSAAIVNPSISSISTTAVTFAMTSYTGTLYYKCL